MGNRAIALLQQLPNARLVPVDRPLAVLAAGIAAELYLRGADALYVALARRLSVALVTWDGEQLARAQGAVEAVTPQVVVE
jgi:predicted nucleic acid-binding protein